MRRHLIPLCALLAALCLAPPVRADLRNFTYTYDWYTPVKGEREIEFWWTQRNAGEADVWLEFEYGVTNEYVVAPYLLLKRETTGDFVVEGWRLEQRYRLGRYARNRLLPALYLEVEKESGEAHELEGKLITSYEFGRGWLWSHNFIIESKVASPSKVEFGYADGLRYAVNRKFHAGVELFGNWTEGKHFFGPVLGLKTSDTSQVLITGGFRYLGEKKGAVRLLYQQEFR